MRKELIVAALGFLIGAATLAGGQDADEGVNERYDRLREALERARAPVPGGAGIPGATAVEFRLLPVYDLTAGIRDFWPPDHRIGPSDSEHPLFGGMSEESVQPTGTIEEIMEMVRATVWPASWEQHWIAAVGQTLLLTQSQAVLKDVEKFLDRRLRLAAHRGVAVEARVLDLPRPLYRTLSAGSTTAFTAEQDKALADAVAAKTASEVFSARTLGFAGQQFVIWHGKQVAIVSGAEAVVAKQSTGPDPRVDILQAGGYVAVRPSVGDDTSRITLDIDVLFDDLQALKTRDTGDSGIVDEPNLLSSRTRTTLKIPNRTWALAGGGTPHGDSVRIMVVRATFLARGGGAK